jgi:hypothetical protein
VLEQEHASELGEPVGRVVERPQQALAVVDCQRQDDGAERERLLEHTSCGLIDEAGELPNVGVGKR